MISELRVPSTAKPRLSPVAAGLIVVALAAFAFGLSVNPSRANDLFWQLRTGQLILAQHHAPHFDQYSWTRHGQPWVAHEWLTFVIFRLCYDWSGFGGIWLLTAVLTAVISVILYRLVGDQTRLANDGERAPITACLLTAFAMISAGAFFQPRPQLFTYLFTLVTLGTILSVRRHVREASGGDATKPLVRPLWVLVPLFALWANLHAGVLVGLALLGIFTIGDAVAEVAAHRSGTHSESGSPWRALAVVTLACFAATLITPYSFHEYENFAATITNAPMLNAVGEWAAPNFHDSFGKLFEAYSIVVLAALFLTPLRHDPSELAILALLGHEALTGSRNVPLFALVGAVLIARHFQSALVRVLYGKTQGNTAAPADSLFGPAPSTVIVGAVAAAIIFSALMRTASTLKQSAPQSGSVVDRIALASIAYGDYPARACDFIEREGFPASMRMYNTYDDGGFLIWRMPEHPVFVDSRADVYFGSIFTEVKKITDGSLDWRTVMDRHNVDFIVSPVAEAQSRGYLAAPDWALVYVDNADLDKHPARYDRNNTFIFIRRVPQFAGLIARCRRDCPAIASGGMRRYSRYLSTR